MHLSIETIFRVEGEAQAYLLHVGGFSGTAGDGLKLNNGAKFSTLDRDNDNHPYPKQMKIHCAQYFRGAWWYSK